MRYNLHARPNVGIYKVERGRKALNACVFATSKKKEKIHRNWNFFSFAKTYIFFLGHAGKGTEIATKYTKLHGHRSNCVDRLNFPFILLPGETYWMMSSPSVILRRCISFYFLVRMYRLMKKFASNTFNHFSYDFPKECAMRAYNKLCIKFLILFRIATQFNCIQAGNEYMCETSTGSSTIAHCSNCKRAEMGEHWLRFDEVFFS